MGISDWIASISVGVAILSIVTNIIQFRYSRRQSDKEQEIKIAEQKTVVLKRLSRLNILTTRTISRFEDIINLSDRIKHPNMRRVVNYLKAQLKATNEKLCERQRKISESHSKISKSPINRLNHLELEEILSEIEPQISRYESEVFEEAFQEVGKYVLLAIRISQRLPENYAKSEDFQTEMLVEFAELFESDAFKPIKT
ncbi:MAG: hypothetical protein JW725_00310 [Candidatus Babeliaceae bacterium]|nr:hypothetical protein [Candidatus Babeliaceae bacterium]